MIVDGALLHMGAAPGQLPPPPQRLSVLYARHIQEASSDVRANLPHSAALMWLPCDQISLLQEILGRHIMLPERLEALPATTFLRDPQRRAP